MGEAAALTRKAVELALAGDPAALRLSLDRTVAPRRAASERSSSLCRRSTAPTTSWLR
jgi:hypothetical protein